MLLLGDPPFLTLVVAAKASGKSEVIKYICYNYREKFNCIVVISPTALNGFYDFLPENKVFDKYDPAIIEDIFKRQEVFKKSGQNVHVLIIFDDVLANEEVGLARRVSELNKLFSANRHWNLSAIFVSQKMKALPMMLRENVDYAIIGRCISAAYDALYETFGTQDKRTFKNMIQIHTQNYNFVLYKANVPNQADHFSSFRIPDAFLKKRFKLVF